MTDPNPDPNYQPAEEAPYVPEDIPPIPDEQVGDGQPAPDELVVSADPEAFI